MRKILVTVIMFLSCYTVFTQNTDSCNYELKGIILDADTKEALPYVQVKVKEKQTTTNVDGEFHFYNLCDESNTLIISCFGYCDTICEHFHEHGKTPHIYLKHEAVSLSEVIITVESKEEKGTASLSQSSINKEELSANPTQTLASALSQIDGVTFTSTGNNIQLPVIHGLYGNRILILNNGIKHGFQNWGTDHAPEIDISTANNITVIKGAAGVRYGPEALGGVIIVEPNPLYLNEAFKTTIGTGYQTNGRGYFLNSEISQGLNKWSYHVGANYNQIGDRNTPDYSLTNSGKIEKSANGGVRYRTNSMDFKMYYSFVDQNLALLRSSVAESGNAFVEAINADEPRIINSFSYTIGEPNQLTQHHLGKAEINWWYSEKGKLTFIFGKQLNKRKEFDVRRNADKPIINLDLITTDYQLEWKHPDWKKLDGVVGVQRFTQDNDNNPGTGTTPFIPNYNILRYSGFIVESLKDGDNTFETGIRLDYEYNNVRGREADKSIFRDKYSFTNWTFSFGYIRQISDNTTFRSNIGTAWRTPNMAELYSFGQHGFKTSFGLLRYNTDEEGDLTTDEVLTISESNVSPEKGYKWVNEWQAQKKKNTYTLTAYSHYIENFIFDRPVAVIGTIRGPMPVFIFDQADAFFVGVDFTWMKKWTDSFKGIFGVSYLWSQNVKKDEPLIDQPPITAKYDFVWDMKKFWKVKTSQLFIKPSYTLRQFQAPRTVRPNEIIDRTVVVTPESTIFDFRDAPPSYFLLDISWQLKLKRFGVNFSVNNVLNTRYRNYLNEMRYFADEPGRNFLFTINYMFNAKSKTK